MKRHRITAYALLAFFPFFADGCAAIEVFIKILHCLAYGTCSEAIQEEPPCVPGLVCEAPYCLWAEENGGFEADEFDPVRWYGDEVDVLPFACESYQALEFIATTPEGPSPSPSSQAFQVIDYRALIPEAARDTRRRVRAHAAFSMFDPLRTDIDRRFGLRIDAYTGDPAAFPRSGDPETIPTETSSYRRLDTSAVTLTHDVNGAEWQPLVVALWLPEGTDFFVVLLEAYEDRTNEDANDIDDEFDIHLADFVQVTIDGGNTPPEARPDRVFTLEDTPTSSAVYANDVDATSYLDRTSVTIVEAPAAGTAQAGNDGDIHYTPNPGFTGTDSLRYTIADEEGLVSNAALVTISVRNVNVAPVAADDAYMVPPGGLLIVPDALGVLANDTDGDGDALTAVLATDVTDGTLSLDPSGAFTYQAGPGFTGTDTFTYHADDGTVPSNEALVTITGTGYDLSITKTATPPTVSPSNEATFTVTVRNSGPEAAQDVLVDDPLDVFGITLRNVDVSQGTYNQTTGLWQVGDLAGGEVATMNATALIHITHTNTARIVDGLGPNDDPTNNEASAEVTVVL